MKVSVIMPVYNSEDTVRDAIDSILQQNFRNFEFIIINDGSTDATVGILNEYKHRDDRIVIVNQPRMGIIYSLNQGLRIAQGEYIIRQDSDDVSLPDRIEKQIEYIEQNNLDIVSSFAFLINKKGAVLKIMRCPLSHNDIVYKLEIYNCILHPTVMFRKRSILSIGGYDQNHELVEDYALYLKAILKGLRFGAVSKPLVKIRFHINSLTVKYRRKQLFGAISAQTWYFSRKDKFKPKYVFYMMPHICGILVPSYLRNIRMLLRNRKT